MSPIVREIIRGARSNFLGERDKIFSSDFLSFNFVRNGFSGGHFCVPQFVFDN